MTLPQKKTHSLFIDIQRLILKLQTHFAQVAPLSAKPSSPSDVTLSHASPPRLRTLSALQIQLERQRFRGTPEQLLSTLSEISSLTGDSHLKAALYHAQGLLYLKYPDRQERALSFFRAALELDPTEEGPFSSLRQLLERRDDWRLLEREHLKMLGRLKRTSPKASNFPFVLWRGLGVLYDQRLQQPENAMIAYEQARALSPQDLEILNKLSEMYLKASKYEAIIEIQRALIFLEKDLRSPSARRSYHQMLKASLKENESPECNDVAWCISDLLYYLRLGVPSENRYNRAHSPHPSILLSPERLALFKFNPRAWKLLFPSKMSLRLSNIMGLIASACRVLYAPSPDPSWNIIPVQNCCLFSTLFYSLQPLFGLRGLRLYSSPQLKGVRDANTSPPGILVGPELLKKSADRQKVLFAVTRQLALSLPQHSLAAARRSPKLLKFFLEEATWCSDRKRGRTLEMKNVYRALRRLPRSSFSDLNEMTAPLRDASTHLSIKGWLRDVERSALRVGFLFSGSVDIAANSIRDTSHLVSDLNGQDLERDLLSFSVSKSYFQLRTQFHLSIS